MDKYVRNETVLEKIGEKEIYLRIKENQLVRKYVKKESSYCV